MFSLSNKIAIISGAGKGIGKSIALRFAEHGSKVYILDVDKISAEATVELILSEGGNAYFYECNVVTQNEVRGIFETIYKKEKRLDILVNNAGIALIGNLEETCEEDFEKVFEVNVKGIYNCCFAAIGLMKNGGGGVILNMASVAAMIGISDRFAYSASKGAVLSMTYSIAKDYLDDHIRCNSISPARIHTPFVDGYLEEHYKGREKEMFDKLSKTQPIGRMGKPEEVAALALYLCSDEAGFITGVNYPIDGGFTKLNS